MSSFEKFRSFPFEDIVWIFEKVEDIDDDDDSDNEDINEEKCLLSITDKRNSFIGAKTVSQGQAEVNGIEELLKDCFSLPLSGKPRKPTFIHIPWTVDEIVRKSLIAIDVSLTDCASNSLQVTSKKKNLLWRICDNCGRRGEERLFEKCSTCSAVFHCNTQCDKQNLEKTGKHSHSEWCPNMASYMENSGRLQDFPFTYAQATTWPDFTPNKLFKFIKKLGLNEHPLWAREIGASKPGDIPYGELAWDDVAEILDPAPKLTEAKLRNWKEYYNLRQIPLDNPVAAVLTNVLTAYHTVNSFLSVSKYQKSTLTLHLVGCEREADEIKLFKELEYLFPNLTLHIAIIGPHISSKCHNRSVTSGQMTITLYRAQYHKLKLERPDLVIGLNAGLAAYQSWPSTLKLLKEEKICSYFTDYCLYSCEASKLCVESLGVGTTSEPFINPFRSPLRKYCEEHCMPWFSNAFIYRLVYRC